MKMERPRSLPSLSQLHVVVLPKVLQVTDRGGGWIGCGGGTADETTAATAIDEAASACCCAAATIAI